MCLQMGYTFNWYFSGKFRAPVGTSCRSLGEAFFSPKIFGGNVQVIFQNQIFHGIHHEKLLQTWIHICDFMEMSRHNNLEKNVGIVATMLGRLTRPSLQDKELAKIRDSRGYNYADIITCSEAGRFCKSLHVSLLMDDDG